MATATAQTTNAPAQHELERRMLRQMLLIRRFEEKAAEAYALGKIGGVLPPFIRPGAVGVRPRAGFRAERYVVFSYRRPDQGPAPGGPPNAAMGAPFGQETAGSKGQ